MHLLIYIYIIIGSSAQALGCVDRRWGTSNQESFVSIWTLLAPNQCTLSDTLDWARGWAGERPRWTNTVQETWLWQDVASHNWPRTPLQNKLSDLWALMDFAFISVWDTNIANMIWIDSCIQRSLRDVRMYKAHTQTSVGIGFQVCVLYGGGCKVPLECDTHRAVSQSLWGMCFSRQRVYCIVFLLSWKSLITWGQCDNAQQHKSCAHKKILYSVVCVCVWVASEQM